MSSAALALMATLIDKITHSIGPLNRAGKRALLRMLARIRLTMALKVWSICDRCGFKYHARQLRQESTKLAVCEACYDGRFDIKRHPQNRPPPPRLESKRVPDGRAPDDINDYLLLEIGAHLLLENSDSILIDTKPWTITMTTGGA